MCQFVEWKSVGRNTDVTRYCRQITKHNFDELLDGIQSRRFDRVISLVFLTEIFTYMIRMDDMRRQFDQATYMQHTQESVVIVVATWIRCVWKVAGSNHVAAIQHRYFSVTMIVMGRGKMYRSIRSTGLI